MARVEIYTKRYCHYCHSAKQVMQSHGIEFEEHDLSRHPELEQEMRNRSPYRTVPQIFVNNEPIGGFAEMQEQIQSGDFFEKLK